MDITKQRNPETPNQYFFSPEWVYEKVVGLVIQA